MSKEIITIEIKPENISPFNFTKNRLQFINEAVKKMKVEGVKDHKGLKAVTKHRKNIKQMRIAVGKRRIDLNKDLLYQMRQNNCAAKFIITELLPAEIYLKSIEKDIAEAKAKIREEKEAALMERLQSRVDQLVPFNIVPELLLLKKMSDKEFETFLKGVISAHNEAEKERLKNVQSLASQNQALAEENAHLKQQLPAAAPLEQSSPVNISTDFNTVHIGTVKDIVNAYCENIKAIQLPVIPEEIPELRTAFNNGHAMILKGINLILAATK